MRSHTPEKQNNKKLTLPQQPLTNNSWWLGVGSHGSLPHPCWNVNWLELLQIFAGNHKLYNFMGANGSVMSRGHYF